MGRVYAAEHVVTGASVALKIASSATLAKMGALQNEINILSRITHHGIVRLLEWGRHEGVPWYAMERIQGPTLRDALARRVATTRSAEVHDEESPRTSESGPAHSILNTGVRVIGSRDATMEVLPRSARSGEACLHVCETLDWVGFAQLFGELCAAIAHLHDLGLRHGDLKPDNVFLVGACHPLLADLGVASFAVLGREKLQLAPSDLGSVAYMAPEQLTRGHADTRSDLYALGCILYEWLAGKHPFASPNAFAMRLAHIERMPPRLSELLPDVPPRLDSLVAQLLSKDPCDRPGRAQDVLETFVSLGATIDAPFESTAGAPILFRAPLTGRNDLLEALGKRLDDGQCGQGSVTRLAGASGCGKTRLLNELAALGRARNYAVFGLGPRQEHALAELLMQLEASSLDGGLPPSVALGPSPPSSGVPSRVVVTPNQVGARQQLLAEAMLALRVRATLDPVLLLVDDAEHLDELSSELVRRLEGSTRQLPVVIMLAQGSPSETPGHDSLIPPLDDEAVEGIACSMLGVEELPQGLEEFLAARAAGNPRLVGEWLRAAISSGALTYQRRRGWSLSQLAPSELRSIVSAPDSLVKLVEQRVAGLPSDARLLLELAVVLGDEFEPSHLEGLSALEPSLHQQALATLQAGDVLELTPTGRLRFVYSTLRERVYAELPSERAIALHRAAAAVLMPAVSSSPDLAKRLAEHLSQSGEEKSASKYFELAARLAAKNLRFRDAEALLTRALAGPEDTGDRDERARIRHASETLGDIRLMLQEGAAAIAAFQQALDHDPESATEHARLERKMAEASQGDRPAARQHLARAEEVLGSDAPDNIERRAEWLQVNLVKMLVGYFEGELDALLGLAEWLAPFVEKFGSTKQKGTFYSHRAAVRMRARRYRPGEEVKADLERALALHKTDRDRQAESMTRFLSDMSTLFDYDDSAELDAVRQGFEQALQVGRRVDDLTLQLRAGTYLCIALRRQGHQQRCGRMSTTLLSQAELHASADYQGAALGNLAWVSLRDGEPQEAAKLAEQAFSVWDAANSQYPFQWLAALPWLATLTSTAPPGGLDMQRARWLAKRLVDPLQSWLPVSVEQELLTLSSGGTAACDAVGRVLAAAGHCGLL